MTSNFEFKVGTTLFLRPRSGKVPPWGKRLTRREALWTAAASRRFLCRELARGPASTFTERHSDAARNLQAARHIT